MDKPFIIAIDENAEHRLLLQQALESRYRSDYSIRVHGTTKDAEREIEQATGEERVAIWLSAADISGCSALLEKCRQRWPNTKRALMVTAWGGLSNSAVSDRVLMAMASGVADAVFLKPLVNPDEKFHRELSILLTDWAQANLPRFEAVSILGRANDSFTVWLRDVLDRSICPTGFIDYESPAGQELAKSMNVSVEDLPTLRFLDGRVLLSPNKHELAAAMGAFIEYDPGGYDLVIVGAGPAGLSAAVNAASEGLKTVMVESEAPGGQAGTSTRIRNYMGFPSGIGGSDLALKAIHQSWLLGSEIDFCREVAKLEVVDGMKRLTLDDGVQVNTRAVLICCGVSYRLLDQPGLNELTGRGVYYGAAKTEAPAMTGRQVFIVGGGNAAGQAAVYFARFADRVTILVRGSSLATSMSDYLIREIDATANVNVATNTEMVRANGEHLLESLELRDTRTGKTWTEPAHGVFILIGARPRTEWLKDTLQRDGFGFIVTGDAVRDRLEGWRESLFMETSIPGVFAAGDVRDGSIKRVASAVGEGAAAVPQIHQYLAREQQRLQSRTQASPSL